MSATTDLFPDGFRVWWNPKQPFEIHLVSSDAMFHDGEHDHLGIWITFSRKPESANYHPVNFNRCARALAEQGKPAPALVPETDRRLKNRQAVIRRLAES